jgi:hypothetical protein
MLKNAKVLVILLSGVCAGAHAGQCVVAGRLDDASRWAPRLAALQMFDAQGKVIRASDKAGLALVTQVRVLKAVPISGCDGSKAVAKVDDLAAPAGAAKPSYLAAGKSMVPVKGVSFPAIRSGALVELEI